MQCIDVMKSVGIFVFVFVLVGCFDRSKSTFDNSLNPLVINVLDKSMYDDCHIPHSVHSDFDKVDMYVQNVSKDTEIILYCSNYACGTSDYVGKQLQKLGYKNVFVYEGGMAEWKQAGLPVEGPAKASYLSRVMMKTKSADDSTVPVISMQELAAKLKVAY